MPTVDSRVLYPSVFDDDEVVPCAACGTPSWKHHDLVDLHPYGFATVCPACHDAVLDACWPSAVRERADDAR